LLIEHRFNVNIDSELKKSRREQNRPKQVDIQLQILDKIGQLDQESTDKDTLQDLRKRLQEEQGLLIGSSIELTRHESQTQVLSISPHAVESAFTISTEPMMIPVTGEVLVPMDSKEQIDTSLTTADAKELYQEIKEMRNSIEIAFESAQTPPDVVDHQSPLVSRKYYR
jgi:hypothetical protein